MSVTQRLAEGYLRILVRLLRGLAVICVLALLAAVITTPLWLLAHGAGTLYNLIFLFATLAGLIPVFVLRSRSSRSPRERRSVPIVVVGVVAFLILVLGILGRSLPLLAGGVFALTIPLAWSFGRQR